MQVFLHKILLPDLYIKKSLGLSPKKILSLFLYGRKGLWILTRPSNDCCYSFRNVREEDADTLYAFNFLELIVEDHRSSLLPLLTPKTATGSVLLKELLLKVLQYSLKADHTSQTTI